MRSAAVYVGLWHEGLGWRTYLSPEDHQQELILPCVRRWDCVARRMPQVLIPAARDISTLRLCEDLTVSVAGIRGHKYRAGKGWKQTYCTHVAKRTRLFGVHQYFLIHFFNNFSTEIKVES